MIEFLKSPGANTMGVCFSGKVSADDFRQLNVRLKHLIDLWGHVGLVVVMRDDARFALSARWVGATVRMRSVGHVARLALVGGPRWGRRAHRHLPLTRTGLRFFPPEQLAAAWQWVGQRATDATDRSGGRGSSLADTTRRAVLRQG